MNEKPTHDTPPIQSLDRGLAILEAVAAASEPVPLKQLTDLIGIDRSSVFRLANTLRQRRFLANPKGSKDYILGPTAWRLSRRYGRSVLGTFFHQFLRDLTTRLGETSHFAVREGTQALFIDHHIPTGQVVSVAGQTGEFAPLHCTAHGKALLADFDLNGLKDLLGQAPLHAYTRTTITSLPRRQSGIRRARSWRRWAFHRR
jgi:IclR family acetate operon transcriptional repressor